MGRTPFQMFQLLYGQYFLDFFKIGWILDTKIVFSPISQFFAISQLRSSRKSNCVMLRLRPVLWKMNCVFCEIAIFSQSQFAISQNRNFSQSILQPWMKHRYKHSRYRAFFDANSNLNTIKGHSGSFEVIQGISRLC